MILVDAMKQIPDFPDYQITDDGRIWSKSRIDSIGRKRKGKWLRPTANSHGYLCVQLRNNGKPRMWFIHQLVLATFISPRPVGVECRHLNGIRTDNRLSNLCYGTPSENGYDKIVHRTNCPGERNGFAKLTDDDIIAIRYWHNVIGISMDNIAKRFNIDKSNVSLICRRKHWGHIK